MGYYFLRRLRFFRNVSITVKTFLLCMLLGIPSLMAEPERPMFLPFDVTLGGQKAVTDKPDALFAVVAKPVKPDAALSLDKPVPMLIVNAFACKEDGSVEEATAAAIIFAQNTATVKMDATMDKKPLKPGRYLMNIVANDATARVVFTVEDGTGTLKLPSLESIVGYLKKKAQ